MAIKGGKPYLAYTPLSHYIFCPVVKVVSTQFPPCVPAEIALISTLTRQVCTYQRLTYLLTLSTYRCADLTVRFAADYTPYCKLKTLRTAFSVPYNNVRRARLRILCVENTPPKSKKQPNKRLPFLGSFPQQSSAIQNSRTIAVISRTDAAAITIPENTQRQTKLVFGVVRTYFSVTFPCSKSFFKSGEI